MISDDVFCRRECHIAYSQKKSRGGLSLPQFSQRQPRNSTWILHKYDLYDSQNHHAESLAVWALVLLTVPYPLRK